MEEHLFAHHKYGITLNNLFCNIYQQTQTESIHFNCFQPTCALGKLSSSELEVVSS